ncbi:MAG TPA: GAP family protein [Solirubrobacterales bacterium]|nr:GAP family protein [Solirubrobacterales bacterium]
MDSTQLQIIPLALIMVMGPQILTSIFLVTSTEPVKNSLAMLVGVVTAACLSLLIWYGIVKAIGIDPKEGGGPTTADWVIAGLLALAAIHTFLGRGTASVPKWMTALQEAKPRRAFSLAFLLILLMPTDIVAVISTANWLHDNNHDVLQGWPLVAATTLLMALPIIAYTLLGHRARQAMPGIREWLTTHAWLVNLVVIVYFIYQLLS